MLSICLAVTAFGKLRFRYRLGDLSLCPFVIPFVCRPSLYQRSACSITSGIISAGACTGAQELSRAASGHVHPRSRSLLQTAAAPASGAPATIDVALLSATDAIALLCSRNITSVAYVQALFAHYDNGGFACLNSFITLNRPQVKLECRLLRCQSSTWYKECQTDSH